jgi:hypothetical protein
MAYFVDPADDDYKGCHFTLAGGLTIPPKKPLAYNRPFFRRRSVLFCLALFMFSLIYGLNTVLLRVGNGKETVLTSSASNALVANVGNGSGTATDAEPVPLVSDVPAKPQPAETNTVMQPVPVQVPTPVVNTDGQPPRKKDIRYINDDDVLLKRERYSNAGDKLQANAKVDLISEETLNGKKFYRVEYDGKMGWVQAAFVATAPIPQETINARRDALRAQAKAQARAQTQAETQAKAQAKAEAQARAKAQTQAKVEAQAQAQAEAQARANAQAQAQAEAQQMKEKESNAVEAANYAVNKAGVAKSARKDAVAAARDAKSAASSAGRSRNFSDANSQVEKAKTAKNNAIVAAEIAKTAYNEAQGYVTRANQAAMGVDSKKAADASAKAIKALGEAENAFNEALRAAVEAERYFAEAEKARDRAVVNGIVNIATDGLKINGKKIF